MHMKTQAGIEETFCCVLYRFPFHSSFFSATNSAIPHFHLYSVLFNSKKKPCWLIIVPEQVCENI